MSDKRDNKDLSGAGPKWLNTPVEKPAITDPVELAAWKCAEDNPYSPLFPPKAEVALGDKDEANRYTAISHLPTRNPTTDSLTLDFGDIDPTENERVRQSGRLTFHTTGCTGDPESAAPQDAVAASMMAHLSLPDAPSFLFHLGDIVYKDKKGTQDPGANEPDHLGLRQLYSNEFYQPYKQYSRPIFAIPGNHDGKYKRDSEDGSGPLALKKSPMWHFLTNFCARRPVTWPDNPDAAADPVRRTMTQPYPYFALKMPCARIVGLYANVVNGGALDDPAEGDPLGQNATQYQWLVRQLAHVRDKRKNKHDRRALIVMVHYPPYSGAANFLYRGDPECPLTPAPRPQRFLADILQAAFEAAGEWPDAVFSAHAHLYQRITYYLASDGDGKPRQIPFLIIGSGGHAATGNEGLPAPESLTLSCDERTEGKRRKPPFDLIFPAGFERLRMSDTAQVVAYNDRDFGFMRMSVDIGARTLVGEYFASYPLLAASGISAGAGEATYVPPRYDRFELDLDKHRLR